MAKTVGDFVLDRLDGLRLLDIVGEDQRRHAAPVGRRALLGLLGAPADGRGRPRPDPTQDAGRDLRRAGDDGAGDLLRHGVQARLPAAPLPEQWPVLAPALRVGADGTAAPTARAGCNMHLTSGCNGRDTAIVGDALQLAQQYPGDVRAALRADDPHAWTRPTGDVRPNRRARCT